MFCRVQGVVSGLALASAVIISTSAVAQRISVDVQVSTTRSFVPLQSYGEGETDTGIIFLGGLTDMGLHPFSSGAFPIKKFSTSLHLVRKSDGVVFSGGISHLPQAVQDALTVTAPAAVQFDHTLYVYGGYGPLSDGSSYETRGTVLAIDLDQVESALLASSAVPTSAFSIAPSVEGRVAGAGIVRLSDGHRFALVGGADADGEYPHQGDPEYSEEIHIFDRDVSMTDPILTIAGDPFGDMHRRDVNVVPLTLPAGGGQSRDGLAVVCGVFENGIFPWENPVQWGDGDTDFFVDTNFVQHIGAYEGPTVSLYSASKDANHVLCLSGLSAFDYINGEFMWNPIAPWTDTITQMVMISGVWSDELVVGQMPWPLTNARLILNESLPMNDLRQVLVDELPCNTPVLLGRIYGGIAAESTGDSPPTYASPDVYDVYIRNTGDESGAPESFTRVRGLPVSGGLNDLLESDDARLATRPDTFGPAPINNPAVQLEVVGTIDTISTPSRLCVTVESRASVQNILQRILMFNYSTGQYDLKYSGMTPTADTFRHAEVTTDAANYIHSTTGEVKVLVQHVAVAFSILPTWNAAIDQIVWTAFE